jgi:hypothetical protein
MRRPVVLDRNGALLTVSGLTKRFVMRKSWIVRALTHEPRRFVHAVENVSFQIPRDARSEPGRYPARSRCAGSAGRSARRDRAAARRHDGEPILSGGRRVIIKNGQKQL